MFFFLFLMRNIHKDDRSFQKYTRERERRAKKRLSTWLSCNTSDYIFKHLKRRHLSVVYVPVSILLDDFFLFIFNWKAAEPWMLSETKITVAWALFDQCPITEKLLAVYYDTFCWSYQSCGSGEFLTLLQRQRVWGEQEWRTLLQPGVIL